LATAVFNAPRIISCIDGGNYQASDTVSTSITIDCPGAVLTATVIGPAIMITGTSSQVVIHRNLTFEGGPQLASAGPYITGTEARR
jgi:hypothetical protein